MRLKATFFLIYIFCTGCFGRFSMTKKELKEYYKDKTVKPNFFTIQNDSVKLFCATTGADSLPALLIIHGAPGAWYGSRNLMDDSVIRQHFQIIAVDRPGYNQSRFKNKKKAVTSIDIQAVAIYEAMRINRSHKKGIVMGSSYGAPIAAKIALEFPYSFYHLVMLAPAIDPATEKFWWFHKFIHHGPLKWMLPRYFRTATNEKYAHVKELERLSTQWKNLEISATVVQGDSDKIVAPSNLDYAKKQLEGKKVEFIVLPGEGHLIRIHRPDVIRKILLDHIDQ